jgi:hypothetical protein
VNEYIDMRSSRVDVSYDDSERITIACVRALKRIAEYSFEYGKFKDEWDYSDYYRFSSGPELIIKSIKTQCEYKIGLDYFGIYLSSDLRHNTNLVHMDDQFWKNLLALSEFEGFQYEEHEFTSDKQCETYPKLFKSNKSVIFRIMRKHFFDVTNDDSRYEHKSVGEFKISWTKDKEIDFVVSKCCEAFKHLYRLNYRLWKVSDTKKRNTATQSR